MFYLFLAVIGFIFIFTVIGVREGITSIGIFIVGFILWRLDLLDYVFNAIKWIFSSAVHILENIYSYLDQKVI
ncbi:MAG TPA: hypothetical protein DDY49_13385 [Paenibacillaceae bacterium]|nr:hypothetical protein [Paenibacillaceae bacterium]